MLVVVEHEILEQHKVVTNNENIQIVQTHHAFLKRIVSSQDDEIEIPVGQETTIRFTREVFDIGAGEYMEDTSGEEIAVAVDGIQEKVVPGEGVVFIRSEPGEYIVKSIEPLTKNITIKVVVTG